MRIINLSTRDIIIFYTCIAFNPTHQYYYRYIIFYVNLTAFNSMPS